jgi:hypothetical protein
MVWWIARDQELRFMEWQSLLAGALAVVSVLTLSFAGSAQAGPALRVPLTVRYLPAEGQAAAAPATAMDLRPGRSRRMGGGTRPEVPVATGVPLAKGAVKDASSLRLLDADGKAIPGQFDVQATWSDGSIKWILVSFFAGADGREGQSFTLTDDASMEQPKVARPVTVFDDTNECTLTTGPIRVRLNRQGFRGLSQTWLDVDLDGTFSNEELISNEVDPCGIVAVDDKDRLFTSAAGLVSAVEVEQQGPLHAAVAVRGDLRSPDCPQPLVDYTMRVHAFAGSSLVRVVLTIHNPRAAARAEDGSRFVLGQPGGVRFKSLEYVLPLRLTDGLKQVTLSPEPGKLLDRIPLVGPLGVYQDSSGGQHWFHRAHVNRDNEIPLRFCGYRVSYKGREVDSGLRATPWVDVADMRWAASVAVPLFWQNFPKGLSVEADGTVRVGLWPKEFADLHELQGGEQKTHEFWIYLRHRRTPQFDEHRDAEGPGSYDSADRPAGSQPRRRARPQRMPLDREMMPICLNRPVAWASADAYAGPNAGLDPIRPVQAGKFEKYEAVVAAAVKAKVNLFTHREEADEYGWRNFGDTWAANEFNETGGPHDGLRVVSHYNNEYDLGFGMMMQALRNVDADPNLAKTWWDLAAQGLWHEADIDIYHTLEDPAPIYDGGTFTHTAHGVEAGRSTHRGSPKDELWGQLDWPWKRGSSPEAGHFRTRGIITLYLLTGDRHLRDAAAQATRLVDWKIRNNRFAQIDVPDRSGGNNLQILLDWYLLTWDSRYLESIDRLAASLDYDAVAARTDGNPVGGSAWSCALYLKSLGRLIEALADKGLPTDKLAASDLKYARAIYDHSYARRGWREGSWSYLSCEVMMQAAGLTNDPAEKARFLQAARDAFHALDGNVAADGSAGFWNSKATTMLLQGGGRYMQYAAQTGAEPAGGAGRSAPAGGR